MLFMLFSAGDDQYAIAAREVEEVVPFARLKALPLAHPAFAGLLNFRGDPVPVLDLNQLLGLPPVGAFLTTRIFLCRGAIATHPERLLGFVAENVVATRYLEADQFSAPGATAGSAGYVGKIFEEPDGSYLQWIHPRKILPDEVARELLNGIEAAA